MPEENLIKKPGPYVSEERIDALMKTCYAQVGNPPGTTSTFAHIFLESGFYLATGHSACVAPENFDIEVGTKLAMADGMKKARELLWQLEGYRLHCTLQEEQEPSVSD